MALFLIILKDYATHMSGFHLFVNLRVDSYYVLRVQQVNHAFPNTNKHLAEISLRCQIDNSTLTYELSLWLTNGIVSLVIVLTPDR